MLEFDDVANDQRKVVYQQRNELMAEDDILDGMSSSGLLYILLVLSLSAMVTVIGWFGASMTFPVEKE